MKLSNLLEARKNKYKLDDLHYFDILTQLHSKYGDKLFITYTSIPKFGIYPSSVYNTPIGIYSYPINYLIKNDFDPPWPNFAKPGGTGYMQVFTPKDNTNIINLQKDKFDIRKIAKNTAKVTGCTISDFLKYKETDHPYSKINLQSNDIYSYNRSIWFSMYKCLKKNESTKQGINSRKILIMSGYVGFYDPGMGIIHKNEPNQALFLRTTDLNHLIQINLKEFHVPTNKNDDDDDYDDDDKKVSDILIGVKLKLNQFSKYGHLYEEDIISMLNDVYYLDSIRNVRLSVEYTKLLDSAVEYILTYEDVSNQLLKSVRNILKMKTYRSLFNKTMSLINSNVNLAKKLSLVGFNIYKQGSLSIYDKTVNLLNNQKWYGTLNYQYKIALFIFNNHRELFDKYLRVSNTPYYKFFSEYLNIYGNKKNIPEKYITPELYKQVVFDNPIYLMNVPSDVKQYKEICKMAIKKYPSSIQYVDTNINKNDYYDLCKFACSIDTNCLFYLPVAVQNKIIHELKIPIHK